MKDVTIRPLLRDDLPEAAWSGSPRHLEYMREWISRAELDELVFLGAWVDGDLVGIGYVDFTNVDDAGTLWALAIKESSRSLGIGTQMIVALEEAIVDQGLHAVELRVELENTRAIALYKRLGYFEHGRSIEKWEHEEDDGTVIMYEADCVIMRRELG